jgi:hypothetical protein
MEGRERKPPDSSVSGPLQTFMNVVMLDGEEKLNISDDNWDGEYEDFTDGKSSLDVEPPTPLGIPDNGGTLGR